MTRGRTIFLALLLPVLGLLLSAGWHSWRMVNATEWRIPVSGYDPRDLLAGQYALFQYRWTTKGDVKLCHTRECTLCLSHANGQVVAEIRDKHSHCDAAVDPIASNINLRIVRARNAPPELTAATRIYIPEHDADRINALLAGSRQAMLVARLSKDGRLVPQRIE